MTKKNKKKKKNKTIEQNILYLYNIQVNIRILKRFDLNLDNIVDKQ